MASMITKRKSHEVTSSCGTHSASFMPGEHEAFFPGDDSPALCLPHSRGICQEKIQEVGCHVRRRSLDKMLEVVDACSSGVA